MIKLYRCKFLSEHEIIHWLTEENRLTLLRQQISAEGNDQNDLEELITWCHENCNDVFYYKSEVFYFLDEADFTAFYLKWS